MLPTASRRLLPLVVLIAAALPLEAQNVLIYSESLWMGITRDPSYPTYTVTMVNAATWQTMTTPQFAAFDLIWIGDWSGGTTYPALGATQATWAPAITGRVVIAGMDTQAHGQPGVATFVTDAIDWLLGASGTSLYVGTDVGVDGLAFLSSFGIAGCTGFNCFNQDTVIPSMPTHPVMINSTQASLSGWGQSTHNRVTMAPPTWDVVATGPAGEMVVVVAELVPAPTCTLGAAGGVLSDDIDLALDPDSASASTVDAFLEHSTDGGATFQPSTMAATSPTPNPVTGLPLSISNFVWDSRGDGVALATPQTVIVQATVDDGLAVGTCTVLVQVDNTLICNGICGDCNLNALGPDILDALTAAQIAAALIMPTPTQAACCDVDASMLVSILDALRIAQAAAAIPVVLTCL